MKYTTIHPWASPSLLCPTNKVSFNSYIDFVGVGFNYSKQLG